MTDADENVRFVDFGIAKDGNANPFLTTVGDHMGSLLYVSSRQRQDPIAANHEDDFYSLCLVFYEMISGRRVHLNQARLAIEDSRFPFLLRSALDRALSLPKDWKQHLGKIECVIDLEKQEISKCYVDFYEVLIEEEDSLLAALHDGIPQQDAASVPVLSPDSHRQMMISRVAGFVVNGFDDAVDEICWSGDLVPWVAEVNSKELSLMYGCDYSDEIDGLVARIDIDLYDKKEYQSVRFIADDERILLRFGGAGIKPSLRFFINEKTEISLRSHYLSEEDQRSLYCCGRALAAGVALRAVKSLHSRVRLALAADLK